VLSLKIKKTYLCEIATKFAPCKYGFLGSYRVQSKGIVLAKSEVIYPHPINTTLFPHTIS
jgi:hypothetical protein